MSSGPSRARDCSTLSIVPPSNSYIALYPSTRTVQSALHFTSLKDLFTQTPSRLLWEASSHMLQLMREGCSYTYPPLSIASYSFIQLSELEQYKVKKLARWSSVWLTVVSFTNSTNMAFGKNTFQWIKSFLTDRTQEVLLEEIHSTQADVTSGVPQGNRMC